MGPSGAEGPRGPPSSSLAQLQLRQDFSTPAGEAVTLASLMEAGAWPGDGLQLSPRQRNESLEWLHPEAGPPSSQSSPRSHDQSSPRSQDQEGSPSPARRKLSVGDMSRELKARMGRAAVVSGAEGEGSHVQRSAEGSPSPTHSSGGGSGGEGSPGRGGSPAMWPAPGYFSAESAVAPGGALDKLRGLPTRLPIMTQMTPQKLTRYIRARIARGVSVGRHALPGGAEQDMAKAAMAVVDKELVQTLSQVPSFAWSDEGDDDDDDFSGTLGDEGEEVVDALVHAVGSAVSEMVAQVASRPSSASSDTLRQDVATETSRLVALKLREEGRGSPAPSPPSSR